MVTPQVVVAYHSGFGHTATLAQAVGRGAESTGAAVHLIAVDTVGDEDWAVLDSADAIIFGCPTYMGNVSAGFQAFAERTGRRCMEGTWRDKVGAGFHQLGLQGRRQAANPQCAGGVRRPTPHALSQPRPHGRVEYQRRKRIRSQPARVLAGRRGLHGCRRRRLGGT